MGKLATTGNEMGKTVLAGSFTATGQSGQATSSNQAGGTSNVPPSFRKDFNVSIWGTFVGTVQLERSFDGGTTWIAAAKDTSGTAAAYTAPATLVCYEPEDGVLYRMNCTAFTSGMINYRISE